RTPKTRKNRIWPSASRNGAGKCVKKPSACARNGRIRAMSEKTDGVVHVSSRIHHFLVALALTALVGCSSTPQVRSDGPSSARANAPLTTENFARKLEKDVQQADALLPVGDGADD